MVGEFDDEMSSKMSLFILFASISFQRSQNTVTVSISINRMTLQAYNCSINSILRTAV